MSAVLVGAATVGFFVAPPLVLLGVAAVTIYITLIRPRGARGRTAASRRPWLMFALAAAGVWIALAFVWLITLVSATMGGKCSYDEVRCSRTGEFLSDYGGYGFLAIVLPAVLIAWWATPGRPRRTPSVTSPPAPSP